MSKLKTRQLSGASIIGLAVISMIGGANASVEISKKPTENLKCSGGVCVPTAKNAVFNIKKLEQMLASSNVKITTGPDSIAS